MEANEMAQKDKSIVFRAEPEYLDKIDALGLKLGGVNRSKAIRLAVDEAIIKHVDPGFKGELMVFPAESFDSIVRHYQDRADIAGLESKTLKHVISIITADKGVYKLISEKIGGNDPVEYIEGIKRRYIDKLEELKTWREEQQIERAEYLTSVGKGDE